LVEKLAGTADEGLALTVFFCSWRFPTIINFASGLPR
jgi:hypothetical protein